MTFHSEPDRQILNTLYMFLVDIGMKPTSDTPEGKQDWVKRFYDIVKTKNPLFPTDVPEGKVWGAFTAAVFEGKAQRRGQNIGALRESFDNWIRQEMPKLKPKPPPIENTHTQDVYGRLEQWPDNVLIGQIRTIRSIGAGSNAWLAGTKGARGYCARIIAELTKRGINI